MNHISTKVFQHLCRVVATVALGVGSLSAQAEGQQWKWVAGSDQSNAPVVYPENPGGVGHRGATYRGISWKDKDGNIFLYSGTHALGGRRFHPSADLWKFDVTQGTWRVLSSPTVTEPIYPAEPGGTGSPGHRVDPAVYPDADGNLWLMGGQAYYETEGSPRKNDLWKYTAATNEWTWIAGSKGGNIGSPLPPPTVGQAGQPRTRSNAVLYMDAAGDLLVQGGRVTTSGSGWSEPGERWKYDMSAGQWIWLGSNKYPVYPEQAGQAGEPGLKLLASQCVDAEGNVWLYGGWHDQPDTNLADLWKYDVARSEWIWMNGGKGGHVDAVFPAAFGQVGHPGKRFVGQLWHDNRGNIWLCGGGRPAGSEESTFSNDLWRYNIAAQEWTWEGGTKDNQPRGNYPSSPGGLGVPGFVQHAMNWTDNVGNLWLFGGQGWPKDGDWGALDSLWKLDLYLPTAATDWNLFE